MRRGTLILREFERQFGRAQRGHNRATAAWLAFIEIADMSIRNYDEALHEDLVTLDPVIGTADSSGLVTATIDLTRSFHLGSEEDLVTFTVDLRFEKLSIDGASLPRGLIRGAASHVMSSSSGDERPSFDKFRRQVEQESALGSAMQTGVDATAVGWVLHDPRSDG